MEDSPPRLILVTGASGAGLSTALNILEDVGIMAVDNLPIAMIDTLVALEVETGGRSLAIGLDVRTTGFSPEAVETLVGNLRRKFGAQFTSVFLSASRDDLLRRFNATRRQHPLQHIGSLEEAISADLARMDQVMPHGDIQIDTSAAKPSDLRQCLLSRLEMDKEFQIQVRLLSFSYRRRLPDHTDLVIDMRFASNPHWVAELRQFDGRDPRVITYLEADEVALGVIDSVKSMLVQMLPRMSLEGRPILTVAFGCTGGKHRSVWATETVGKGLRDEGFSVKVAHREIDAGS